MNAPALQKPEEERKPYFTFEGYLCRRKNQSGLDSILKYKMNLKDFDTTAQDLIVETLNTNLKALKVVNYPNGSKMYHINNRVYLERVVDTEDSVRLFSLLPTAAKPYAYAPDSDAFTCGY